PAGSARAAYGVSTTRVPDCSGLDHASATSARARCLVWMCNSPGRDHRDEPGQTLVAGTVEHLERHTANADTDERDAIAPQNPGGQVDRRTGHRADLDEPGGVVVRGGMAAAQRGEYLLGGLTPQIVEDGVEWALGMGDGDTGTKIVLADRNGVIGADAA